MRRLFGFRLRNSWKLFQKDQSGLALAYVTAALPVIIGFSLLAIDVGRLSTLQSSLQHGADALALAGAGELDRSPTAITRANLAIANLVTTNQGLFANAPVTVNSSNVTKCYLSALPASDTTALGDCTNAPNRTTVPADARYVLVQVNPQNFTTIFPATFIGASANTASTQAQAVAGFDAAVCNFTPMFMCNPLEENGNGDLTNDFGLAAMASSYTTRRKIIKFLAFTGGNNTTAVPGQFGFLDIGTGGAKTLGGEIASTAPSECYILNTINPKPGSMTTLRDAFNTRFDMYKGSYNAATYPPGVNVRKGHVTTYSASNGNGNGNGNGSSNGNNGGPSPDPCATNAGTSGNNVPAQVMAFPIDSCFKTNTCSPKANIGGGDWGYDSDSANSDVLFRDASPKIGYWDLNFGASTTLPTPPDGGTYSNSKLPSRYDIYRYEISSGIYNKYSNTNGSTSAPSPNGNATVVSETGTARCAASDNVTPVDTSIGTNGVDRRVIYGAIMNCVANGLQPGGNGTYSALAFGKFFIVRPVGSDDALYTELIDLVYPGDGTGVARDKVQLYR